MTTEKFDMVVKFSKSLDEENYSDTTEEPVGIEEIENGLMDTDPELYIKETEFLDVVLVELSTDSEVSADKLKNSNPKTISRVVPINKVVNTDPYEIVSNLKEMARDKMDPGDSFTMENPLIHEEDKNEYIMDKAGNILQNLDMNRDNKNPKWKVYVEIIGENTGLSILKAK